LLRTTDEIVRFFLCAIIVNSDFIVLMSIEFNTPLISVIVPTFERNDLLEKCLESLKLQSAEKVLYEVVVTDDGKKHTAAEMIRSTYPWVRWVEGPHRGPAANRNNGASHARGQWLIFTDDDCIPEKSWIQEFYRAICGNPETKVFEGRTICKAGIRSPLETAPVNETGGLLWSCNLGVKASFFSKLNGFDTSFPFAHMEDVDFRERIKKEQTKVLFVREALVDHPPRRVANGKKLAALHESSYYFWKVKEHKPGVEWKLFQNILSFRLRAIYHNPFSIDSFLALFRLVQELYYTRINLFKWKKKYSN
jgi:GT2 family glycosyltransferase